jgi:hypothetical protein
VPVSAVAMHTFPQRSISDEHVMKMRRASQHGLQKRTEYGVLWCGPAQVPRYRSTALPSRQEQGRRGLMIPACQGAGAALQVELR